jgi:DNA-binding GntR family transcriptional regulator
VSTGHVASDAARGPLPLQLQRNFDRRTSDAVFRVARSRIVAGEWQAGTRLDLETIAREFDTSTTPVREAMLRLEADGFITKVPYRGSVVRGVEFPFMEEVFALRLRLEGMGARLAARARDDQLVGQLRALLEHATGEESQHDWDSQANANDEFHLLIAQASGASEIGRILGPLLRHSERFIMMLQVDINMITSEHSHLSMVGEVEDRNEDGAERAIRAHVIEMFGMLARDRVPPGGMQFFPALLSKDELKQLRSYGIRPTA